MTRQPGPPARRYRKVFDEVAEEYDRHRRRIPTNSSTKPVRSPGSAAVIMCLRSAGRRALTSLFPVGRSPSSNTAG